MEPKTVEISNRCENFLCSHEDLANFALQLLMFGALHDLVPPICKYCNFTKINTPPWVFFTFFKIVQMVPNCATHHMLANTYRKKLCFTQFSTRMAAWLLLTFFLCLLNQLKSDSYLPKIIFFVCVTESPLKMIKIAFYFILKALFVLKISKFLSCLFDHIEKNGLIRKIRLISSSMTSQLG